MGKFILSIRKSGEYQFNLKAANGQVILVSEGYITKAACENGIASVMKHAPDDHHYDRLMSANGKAYFNLKAINGQIIGTSEFYESPAAREHGIESVKKIAPIAVLEEIEEQFYVS